MALSNKMDDVVKEYLLYRSFNSSLKVLEGESRSDRDKAYRVDKIMENIHTHISNYELSSLREFWNFLDHRLFSRLEHNFGSSVKKVEVSLLKIYVVNAVQTNKMDKVTEFFEKIGSELHGQPEWKEWFVLPFLKNPEENPSFQMYFTKQWQDTLFLSLHNFLSVILQAMPVPTLLNYEEEQKIILGLREENEKLKQQISAMAAKCEVLDYPNAPENILSPSGTGPSDMDLMDDFYVISQDTTLSDKPQAPKPQKKPFFKFGPSSSPGTTKKQLPVMNGTSSSQNSNQTSVPVPRTRPTMQVPPSANIPTATSKEAKDESAAVKSRAKESPIQNSVQKRTSATSQGLSKTTKHENGSMKDRKSETSPVTANNEEKSPFLLMSQEEYAEHRSPLTHCRFSSSGHAVATSDVDGVIKVWSLPSLQTSATIMSKAMLLSLEWVSNTDRHLLLGSKAGSLRLFDVKEKKIIKETSTDQAYPRIVSLSSTPKGDYFVSSASGRLRTPTVAEPASQKPGTLCVWDINTFKLEKQLPLLPGPVAVNCTTFDKSGSKLATGAADGKIRLFNISTGECISSWAGHQGEVYSLQFSQDENSIFSMGSDGRFSEWSIPQSGRQVADLNIHAGACGPFVLTGAGGYKQVQTAKGKLFAFDQSGGHVLTCSNGGGIIYSLNDSHTLTQTLVLSGHKTPVVTVDWSSATDTKMCLTGSMDGKVTLSTLLTQ